MDEIKPTLGDDTNSMTIQRRATALAWDRAPHEVRDACIEAVEEEKRLKEEMKALDAKKTSDVGPRTPQQYAEYVFSFFVKFGVDAEIVKREGPHARTRQSFRIQSRPTVRTAVSHHSCRSRRERCYRYSNVSDVPLDVLISTHS